MGSEGGARGGGDDDELGEWGVARLHPPSVEVEEQRPGFYSKSPPPSCDLLEKKAG